MLAVQRTQRSRGALSLGALLSWGHFSWGTASKIIDQGGFFSYLSAFHNNNDRKGGEREAEGGKKGKRGGETEKGNGKEDGKETPADLKGHLMGMANGRVGRERRGGSSKNKRERERKTLEFT